MNPKRNLVLLSLILLLPALFLCTAGILEEAFRIEAANRLLGALMARAPFKLPFSPVVVLGGPLIAFALNAWKIFHVSADVVNEEFVIALSVKRLAGHLIFLGASGLLIALLLAYAFVENFQIVSR